jgi:hypothetical protein
MQCDDDQSVPQHEVSNCCLLSSRLRVEVASAIRLRIRCQQIPGAVM